MRKILSGIIVAIIILLTTVTVNAVNFEELGMKIDIPNLYYDLKAGIDSQDSNITYYESILRTTKEDLRKQYEQSGIIYDGFQSSSSKQLIISAIENIRTKSDFNLNLLEENEVTQLQEELINANTGMKKQSQEIYENNGIKYVYTLFKNGNETSYQYYTIVNGKAITIALSSKFSNIKNDELKAIVDTIEFDEIQEKPFSIINNPYVLIGAGIGGIVVLIISIIAISITNKKDN